MTDSKAPVFDVPKTCKGGVVVNEGPDFHVEVQDLPVPEPSELLLFLVASSDSRHRYRVSH